MRRLTTIPLFILFACGALYAQKSDVTISNLNIEVVNDYVDVRFTANITNNAAKSSYTLFIVPTLTNGVTRLPLSSIVVQGKRAQIAEKRYTMSRTYPGLGQPIFTENGQQVPYAISVPYQSWMTNMQLVLDKYSRGCCEDVVLPPTLIASDIYLNADAYRAPAEPVRPAVAATVQTAPPPAVQAQVVAEPQPQVGAATATSGQPGTVNMQVTAFVNTPGKYIVVEDPLYADESQLSTADRLALKYTFIEPYSRFELSREKAQNHLLYDYNMPLNLGRGITNTQQYDLDLFIDENRDDALSVYFRQGSHMVDRHFADNNFALVDMISSILEIQNSHDSRIVRIVITGFASPEGSFLLNDRLAWERAVSIKEIIINNTLFSNKKISVFNGSVDWRGLYRLVAESDMYHKYQVLNVIDCAPIWDNVRHISRLDELKRLSGGEPYRYMLANIFPRLRNAAYIKVYYENLNNLYPLYNNREVVVVNPILIP